MQTIGDDISKSVLRSIKQMLDIEPDCHEFDVNVIMDINSALMILNQVALGRVKTPYITGDSETWEDILQDREDLLLIETYIFMKVKLMFDPPMSGVLHEAMERQIEQYEWRLNVNAETPFTDEMLNKYGDEYLKEGVD